MRYEDKDVRVGQLLEEAIPKQRELKKGEQMEIVHDSLGDVELKIKENNVNYVEDESNIVTIERSDPISTIHKKINDAVQSIIP